MDLRTIGPRTRPDGGPVKPFTPMRLRRVRYGVAHLLAWWPMTSFEITLVTLGFYKHEWDEERQCFTCEGKGFIDRDCPNHLYEWARDRGAKCQVCGGAGRVRQQYEERNSFPQSFIRRRDLLFRDFEGVVHLTTKKGKVRRARCSVVKELPEALLTPFGRVSCLTCLAWRG